MYVYVWLDACTTALVKYGNMPMSIILRVAFLDKELLFATYYETVTLI